MAAEPVTDINHAWCVGCWKAFNAYAKRENLCYIYGAKGVKLDSRKKFDALWNAEPAYFCKYSDEEKEQIWNNSKGKTAYDCSGFIAWFVYPWFKTYSTALWNKRSVETSMKDGLAGQLLYTTFGGHGRHIGIDIGNGWCADMGVESTDANVAAGIDSVRIRRLSDVDYWEHSFQIIGVDYTGSTASEIC
jgi:hypothetical protein